MLRSTMNCRIWTAAVAWALLCGAQAADAQELNWAEKMFSDLKIDFGTVARGADVRHDLIIENLYVEEITITDVHTTCGCSAAKPDKTRLKTHEKAVVEVVMDTKKFMRRKDSNVDVTLTFDGRTFKTVRVPITAYIRSDIVLSPGNAAFNDVYYGEGATRTIDISYAGRDDWQIRQVRADSELYHAELKQRARGGGRVEYQLIVTLSPEAPVGTFRDQLVLVTDDRSSPEVPVLVEATIKPDIVVTPDVIPLGALKPGTEKTLRVVVRGNRPFAIENIECESDRECFKVKKWTDEAKTVHVLPLTVVAPAEPGELNEEFTVTIKGRPKPVTFRAHGTIVGG